jgi:photosystem II stability/assembly factor-like uncharacterized protein
MQQPIRRTMLPKATIHVVTGDAVARLSLSDGGPGDVETSLEGSGACCIAVDPIDPHRIYVGTFDDGLFASRDAGATWEPANDGLDDLRVLALAVSRSHRSGGVSAIYAGTEPSNLYRSEDGGRHWQRLPALRELPSEPSWSFPGRPWTHHVRTIALHPTDPEIVLVGIELGGVMRSTDAGASWVDHNPQAHSDAHRMLTHPLAPDRVYEAAGQGIAVSDDSGSSWKPVEEGLDRHYAWAAAVDSDDPDLWYVAVSSGPFAAHGRGDGEALIVRSTVDGWSPVAGWGDSPALRRMPYALATLPERPGTLVAGLRGGLLMLSEDQGDSWSRLQVELPDVVDIAASHAPVRDG